MSLDNITLGDLIKDIISDERYRDKLVSEGGLVDAPPYVKDEVRKIEESLNERYQELSRREQEYRKK